MLVFKLKLSTLQQVEPQKSFRESFRESSAKAHRNASMIEASIAYAIAKESNFLRFTSHNFSVSPAGLALNVPNFKSFSESLIETLFQCHRIMCSRWLTLEINIRDERTRDLPREWSLLSGGFFSKMLHDYDSLDVKISVSLSCLFSFSSQVSHKLWPTIGLQL